MVHSVYRPSASAVGPQHQESTSHGQVLFKVPHLIMADYSPPVEDLATEGFPLIGGRLDYIDGKRVGVVVYKRRLHPINLFMWPESNPSNHALRLESRNGINLFYWRWQGVAYWAVSDLNAAERRQLRDLL